MPGQKIGEGAHGVINLQKNGSVMKHLKDYTDTQSLQLFLAEIKLLGSISHRHIVKGCGFDMHGARPVLAMEFLPGGCLATLLMREMGCSGRQYTNADALRWGTQVASALTYLHGEGIVFRDLSAANVVLTDRVPAKADIKLIDFGLHKRLPKRSAALPAEGKEAAISISRSRSERAVFFMRADSGSSSPAASPLTGETGSYTYMAPEVTRHESYDEKVDVFGLGCLLYELFARELRSAALLSQHADSTGDAARNYAHKVAGGFRPGMPRSFPEPLARLIGACWAQSPRRRPSCAAVLEQLEAMQASGALASMDRRPRGLFACFGGS